MLIHNIYVYAMSKMLAILYSTRCSLIGTIREGTGRLAPNTVRIMTLLI